MCKLYGPIHFLRLFVKLGANFTYTPLDDKSIQLLLFYIDDFLKVGYNIVGHMVSYLQKKATSTLYFRCLSAPSLCNIGADY